MELKPEQLASRLREALPPIILLSSDDAFQLQENSDAARQAAIRQGYTQRCKIAIERPADWADLIQQAQSQSLFDERKLLEIHLPNAKPGDSGAKVLQEYIGLQSDDCRLLMTMGKLDRQSLRSKWYRSIEANAVVCRLWPIGVRELPRWLNNRAKTAGFQIDQDAVQLLTDRVEGNLLAAAQELDKLLLLSEDRRISIELVRDSVGNSARYNSFELVEHCLLGNIPQALRMLFGLRSEGVDARAVLWAFSYETRQLSDVLAAGPQDAQRRVQQLRIAFPRKKAMQAYLRRTAGQESQLLSRLCFKVDKQIKGAEAGDPWDSLAELVTLLGGKPTPLVTSTLRH